MSHRQPQNTDPLRWPRCWHNSSSPPRGSLYCAWNITIPGNWVSSNVPRGFPKVGLRSGFPLKNEGTWERKLGNFASWELKFWPKTRLEMQVFFIKLQMGAHERRIDGKLGGYGAPTGLKKGGHDRCTSPYPLSRSVPPPPGACNPCIYVPRLTTLSKKFTQCWLRRTQLIVGQFLPKTG